MGMNKKQRTSTDALTGAIDAIKKGYAEKIIIWRHEQDDYYVLETVTQEEELAEDLDKFPLRLAMIIDHHTITMINKLNKMQCVIRFEDGSI
jgi:hypothetical protein